MIPCRKNRFGVGRLVVAPRAVELYVKGGAGEMRLAKKALSTTGIILEDNHFLVKWLTPHGVYWSVREELDVL